MLASGETTKGFVQNNNMQNKLIIQYLIETNTTAYMYMYVPDEYILCIMHRRTLTFCWMKDDEEKVRVVFVTQHERYRVTETPFLIPTSLGRKGLSEVISHLLQG